MLVGQLTGTVAATFAGGAALVIALVMIVVATWRDSAPAHPIVLVLAAIGH